MKGQREKAEGKEIEVFNCPECRTEFELKEGQQVADMTGNDFIGNMLEVLAIQRRTNQIQSNCCERKTDQLSVGVWNVSNTFVASVLLFMEIGVRLRSTLCSP